MTELENELNPSQLEVVNSTEGPVLVIAGAGSGKTRVIEYRVLSLIRKKIPPQSILLLTFTRRAAESMLSRASARDPRASSVEGGTFHSFAYSVLKKYSPLIGFDSFSILDEDDSRDAVGIAAKKAGVYDTDKKFPKKDTLKKIISMSVNKQKALEDVLEKEYPDYLDYLPLIERIKNDYQRYKIDKGYFDFDDLLVFLKTLLSKREDLRLKLSGKYRYIMIDEYQDTNKLQADITFLLGKDHGNVMVVGDDAQSIYGFRGATHENIMGFSRLFPKARLIKLEANYRSHQKILDVANAVLSDMKNKFSKTLVSADKGGGERPGLLLFKDGYDQAGWIAERISRFCAEGIPAGEQAVLFRSSYVSIPLQVELERRGIPFEVFGGLKFYETAHVKDLICHLKVIANPKDELSWMRIFTLLGGVGPKTAQGIIAKIDPSRPLPGIIENCINPRVKGKKYEHDFARLTDALGAAGQQKSVYARFTQFLDYYYPVMKEKFDDWQQRINDLEALKEICLKYDSLDDFLADFAIDPPEKGAAGRASGGQERQKPVCLSTIHSAKGLEWECVFLIGLVEGVLPVSFALEDEESIEEEHRLFYVALTRAKKHLFLCAHYENKGFSYSQFNQISRFIDTPGVLAKLEQKADSDQYEEEPTF